VPRPHPRLDALTDREREIVGLVGEGLSNEEIAERLVVSPATARTHVSRAMVKLGPRRSSTGLRVVCAPIALNSPCGGNRNTRFLRPRAA
jgi:DNA-binding NarL/FixJ family response regulator